MICDECDDQQAVFCCSECGQLLCSDCDMSLHLKGKRRTHVRVAEPAPTRKTSDLTLAVYWDCSVLYPRSRAELKNSLDSVTGGQVADIRVYAPHFLSLAKDMRELGLTLVTRKGLSVYESIIMDISLKVRVARPSALVLLSASESLFRSFLRELSHSIPGLVIIYGKGTLPMSLSTIDGQEWTSSGVGVSLHHPEPSFSQICRPLIAHLRTLADSGQVQTPLSELTTVEGVTEAIASALQEELICVQKCPWDETRDSLVSLKATRPSIELLQWVFKSAREDQVTPSEVYIRELLATVFGCRLESREWEALLRLPRLPLLVTSGIDSLTCLPARIIVPKGEAWAVSDDVETEATMPVYIQKVLAEAKAGKELYGWIKHLQLCLPRESSPPLGRIVGWVRTVIGEAPKCPKPSLEEAQLATADLLSACPEGLALPLLPHLLAFKFCRPIHASYFGLSKLSDLLEGVPEVCVESSGKELLAVLAGHSSLTSTSDGEAYSLARGLNAASVGEGLETAKWTEALDLLDYYEPHLKDRRHSYSRSVDLRPSQRWVREELPGFRSGLDLETPSISSDRLETLSEEDSSSPGLEEKQPASPFDGLSV